MRTPAALLVAATSTCVLLGAQPGAAHIELDEPLVRHSNGDNGDSAAGEINKDGPCGLGGPDDERDPARVTTLLAGSTFTVTWRETIGHSGRNRIAFSPDGDVQSDFDANVLVDIPDPPGSSGNTGDGIKWAAEITVPSEPCTNCTLQVIQAMTGNTETPIATPSASSTYFQCADITIVASEDELLPPPEDPDGPNDGATTGCAATPSAPLLLALALLPLFGRARRRHPRVA